MLVTPARKKQYAITSPYYLCIGHLCHDKVRGANVLGGTAAYVSLAARLLGVQAGVLTSVGPEFAFFSVFEENGIPVWNKPAAETTVFENVYQGGRRTQYLDACAETLGPEDVRPECAAAPIVQFCPIADEVDLALLRAFPHALKVATIQGWLRRWDARGRVFPKAMDWRQLTGLDLVLLSDADIEGFEDALPEIAAAAGVLVMTQGARGATVFHQGGQRHFPAFPVVEVDATGAGDVFAAAFTICYEQTRDLARAAAFAHSAASFAVEGRAIGRLHQLRLIQTRLKQYRERFPDVLS